MTKARRGGSRWLAGSLALLALGCGAPAAPSREVPERSQRSVALPERLGWVSSERASGALPSAIALGGRTSGRVLVYLQFPEPERGRQLLRAELWLSLAAKTASPIDVELSRSDPAGNELASWSDQPHARYPRVTAKLGGRGTRESLDVSELLSAPSKAGEPLRVLLRAEPDAPEPVLLETGAFGGAAPRLELYWR